MTFATAVPILFTSFVYHTNVYWSVIHGIKRKPHLSVVWNWYHFVAIAILHQPRPTDSADINTRMHGGFLLVLKLYYQYQNQRLAKLSPDENYHQLWKEQRFKRFVTWKWFASNKKLHFLDSFISKILKTFICWPAMRYLLNTVKPVFPMTNKYQVNIV